MTNEGIQPPPQELNTDSRMLVPQAGNQENIGGVRETTEQDRLREMLTRIGEKCIELTDDPQTDIDPSTLFSWKHKSDGKVDSKATWKQIAEPKLPEGVAIEKAVKLPQLDLGYTTFITLADADGNKVCVQRNAGRTQAIRSLGESVPVPEDHQEISFTTLRRSELKPGGALGIGKQYIYHRDRVVIGTTPEATRMESTQFVNKKTYRHFQEIFPYTLALSDLSVDASIEQGEVQVNPTPEDYAAILKLLEQGQIDSKDMARTIARMRQHDLFITEQEFQEKSDYYAQEKKLREDSQKENVDEGQNIVDSTIEEASSQILENPTSDPTI